MTTLVADIGVNQGILQPIILRRTRDGGYEVIAGGRRFTALKQLRGPDGVLHTGEYRLVEWDDDRCIRAAVSENNEREDLSPLAEGRFLNNLAQRLAEQGVDVSEDLLEKKTGINDSRISDERALAEKVHMLPGSWQEALSTPANCRSGDKPVITVTHYKHIRKYVNGEIPEKVLELMTTAADERWSAKTLKDEIEVLEGKKPKGGKPKGGGNGEPKQRDPEGEPDYKGVQRSLNAALAKTGQDAELAGLIEAAIQKVNDRLTTQKVNPEETDEGTTNNEQQKTA